MPALPRYVRVHLSVGNSPREPQGMTISLTDQQRRAVESESRDVLVVAAAGSGKTRVLTERIRFLIEQRGVSPSSMMCLTFTRKAAGELLSRLAASFGDGFDPRRKGMLIGTFHSVALTILRAEGDKLGLLPDSIGILEPDDADMILDMVCRDLGYLIRKAWCKPLSWERVSTYRESQYTGARPKWLTSNVEHLYDRIHSLYRNTCLGMNVLDFGMILTECRRLLIEFPDVLTRYREKVRHVLVDELQDSDATQYDLHDFFAPPATFFGVGDTRQAIYGFRGARPDLMLERHPLAEVVNLTDCFRCGASIVTAANSLIARNAEPMTEPLECATGRAGRVHVFNGRSADVAAKIMGLRETGYAWRDTAVLYRAHRTGKRLAEVFGEFEIPHHRVGASFELCETPEFKTIHRILRLIANPRDDVAFLGLVPLFGIDSVTLAEIRKRASSNAWSLWKAYSDRPALGSEFRLIVHGVGDCIDALNEEEPALANEILESIKIEFLPPDAANFSIFRAISWWQQHAESMTLPELLRWFALRDSQDDLVTGDVVQLMTVHAAKGLEFPSVIVANLNEGNFPSSRAANEPEGVREERRLAYVAMTRAKETLGLHYRKPEDQDPTRKIKAPSRFLAESGVAK